VTSVWLYRAEKTEQPATTGEQTHLLTWGDYGGSTFAALAVVLGCAFGASDPNQGWIEVRSALCGFYECGGERGAAGCGSVDSPTAVGSDDKATAVRISIGRMHNFI
jgi:hypothetical protein